MSIYIFFSVAAQELQAILSMRWRYKRRSVIKFVLMLLTVFALGILFANFYVYTPLQLNSQEEDALPSIVMKTSKRNQLVGE